MQATVILFATGLVASLLFAVTTTARIPELQTLVRIAPAQYAGGLIVGFYILSITVLAPRFGVGNAIRFARSTQNRRALSADRLPTANVGISFVSSSIAIHRYWSPIRGIFSSLIRQHLQIFQAHEPG